MKELSKSKKREKELYKVTIVGSVTNIILTAGKLFAGIVGHSGAMIADAIHSLSDLVTDLLVLIFVKISSKPKDECHDYGHGKYETLATVIIGLILFAVGLGILDNSVHNIIDVLNGKVIERPGIIAIVAAAVSIISKEALYWYTIKTGKKYNSPSVMANAWHHRSDAMSSVGTLLGISGAHFLGEHWRILDPIAAIVVTILIAKVSFDLIVPGLNELLDRSLPKDLEDEIISVVMQDHTLSDPHNLKTRRIGANITIELHVRVPGTMTVIQSHYATEDIERRLKDKYGKGTQVIVHVEPEKENE